MFKFTLTILLISLALVQSADWAGTYTPSATDISCCYPGTVTLQQSSGTVSYSWNWDASSQSCNYLGANGQAFSGSVSVGSATTFDIPPTSFGTIGTFAGNLTLESNHDVIFQSPNGHCNTRFVYQQGSSPSTPSTGTWAGSYLVSEESTSSCCYPSGVVTVTQSSNTGSASWTWGSQGACSTIGVSGSSFSGSLSISDNSDTVSIPRTTIGSGSFAGTLVRKSNTWLQFTSTDDSNCQFNAYSASATHMMLSIGSLLIVILYIFA